MPNLFEQFLNNVNRGYGQVDKNVFGGLLPGGAATPIGAAYQGVKGTRLEPVPSSTNRRVASLIDAGTGAIAKAQPFVENSIKALPNSMQSGIASGLNALPFSANLFARYYAGIGNKNLQIPESATAGIKQVLDTSTKYLPQRISGLESLVEAATDRLNAAKAGTLVYASNQFGFTPTIQSFNNELAELKSNLNRVKQGDIAFSAYRARDQNPLTSPATSFGNVWFRPDGNGYRANEKYDFVYGNADAKKPMGPFESEIKGEVELTPSQIYASAAVNPTFGSIAAMSPLTQVGRAIISKLPDKSFNYPIVIR
jgi:hypothetical protein